MSELIDYYNTGYDRDSQGYYTNTRWLCQTFTASESYVIESIKFWAANPELSSGTITLSIKAVDGATGKPTGVDLASGTLDASLLAESYAMVTIDLDTSYSLTSGEQYAIVVRNSVAEYLYWGYDGTSPTYSGGSFGSSNNSGGSWTMLTIFDFLFENWGTTLSTTPSDIVAYKRLVVAGNDAIYYEVI